MEFCYQLYKKMTNKIFGLEYKRNIASIIANYYWKNYLELDRIIKNKTNVLKNISLEDINQKFEENMLDKAKDEILKWQNYKELAVYYAHLSKSKLKLFLTPKSRLEKELEKIKREYYHKQKEK